MVNKKHLWVPLAAAAMALAATTGQAQETSFAATLTAAANLPEPTDSKATGELKLTLSPDGKKLSYTLTVKDLSNASAGDIHLGPDTANGPLVLKLFPTHGATAKKGPFSGVLAEGTLTAADLIGPLTGSGMDDLVEQMRTGNTYVNIHTSDGVDPPNSGPGDYRVGEIRGQIK